MSLSSQIKEYCNVKLRSIKVVFDQVEIMVDKDNLLKLIQFLKEYITSCSKWTYDKTYTKQRKTRKYKTIKKNNEKQRKPHRIYGTTWKKKQKNNEQQ